MLMHPPPKAELIAVIEELLPQALQLLDQKSFGQKVYFINGRRQCRTLDVLAQTEWKQVKVALRSDGNLCLVWGWHNYVNVPRPEKPNGLWNKLRWAVRYHAFGISLGSFWRRLSPLRLGIVAYQLDEIVDPLYAGYKFPLWAHTARSGRAGANRV